VLPDCIQIWRNGRFQKLDPRDLAGAGFETGATERTLKFVPTRGGCWRTVYIFFITSQASPRLYFSLLVIS
jgi:hypothetical protein